MGDRSSSEHAHLDTSGCDSDTTSGRTGPGRNSPTNTPELSSDGDVFAVLNSNVIDQSSQNLLVNTDLVSTQEERVEGTHAPLTKGAPHEWLSVLLDATILLAPIFFLIVAILCLLLNGQEVSVYGGKIKAITLLAPTIFPIVYAAILGKSLRRIGLFKAQRSSTIGTLEQLIGCQSFFASIERQFGLRRIDFLGVTILAAWLLSPLGGQASLRLLSTQPFTVAINATVKYISIEGFQNYTLLDYHLEEYYWSRYAPLYMTALQTSPQNFDKPTDFFGNVKIPNLNSLSTAVSTTELSRDWRSVGKDSTIAYTSLLGVPVVDVPRIGNISFQLESSYWEVKCQRLNAPVSFPIPNENSTESANAEHWLGALTTGPTLTSFDMFLHNVDNSSWINNQVQMTFDYVSKTSTYQFTNTTCTATFRLVESEVNCEAAACTVGRMRDLDRDISYMFDPLVDRAPSPRQNWSEFFEILCNYMPGADRGPHYSTITSELVEQFILDPYSVITVDAGLGAIMDMSWVDLTTLPTDIFSHRLQIAMNTFWDATIGLEYRVGNLTSQNIRKGASAMSAWNTTSAIGERYNGDQYVCNTTFAALTIAISFFLIMAGSVSVILGYITKAPDILGYVSTCARNNPYFKKRVPSHLDGLEAARFLRDVRVIIGDVRKKDGIGYIAFASMDVDPGQVKKRRLYD